MTEQELFQAILQAEANDRELTEILKKIRAGTADFQDTQRYSARCAEIEAKILSQNLSPAGTGQNEQNCQNLLENQFEDTIQKESAVQKALDQKQNIHIQPKKPKFPAVRVQKAAHSMEDETVSEDVLRRRAEIAVANIMNSFHDDYIRENADFRQKTGLKCRVSRIGASKCCPWCQKISGTFEVGHEPADFWRRHDNCTCQIIYENQKVRQRLSGSGMGWQVNSESQRRQAQRIQYKPTRFTREQAQALESQQLSQYRGLTIAGKTGIIVTDRKMSASIQNPPDFSKYSVADNAEAVKIIQKTISETLGIPENDINLNGIRNTEVLDPFVKRLQKIQADTGMQFPKIISMEVIAGDTCCIANYQPIENTFYISSRYFNSKEALTDTLKDWAGKNILPKQAKSIAYLAEHESAHMRIPDSLLTQEEAIKIWKKRKLLNQNDADIYEYFADATAIYRMNPNISDNNVIKAMEYLKNGGVIV